MILLTRVCVLIVFTIAVVHARECSTPSCCDDHQFCRFWSTRGECSVNPDWMLQNCEMSCNVCAGSTVTQQPRLIDTVSSVGMGPRRQQPTPSVGAPNGCPAVMTRTVELRRILTPDEQQSLWRSRSCSDLQTPSDCQSNICYHKKYRSYDGTCNNLQRTLEGAAYSTFRRLLSPDYDDGRQTLAQRGRPSARELVTFLLANEHVIPLKANSLLMAFAQFLAHDMTKNGLEGSCRCGDNTVNCANIPIPHSDPRSRKVPCIAFKRAVPACASSLGSVREQINENTAFIDASQVYHSNLKSAESARMGAFMKVEVLSGKSFPPLQGGRSLMVGDNRNAIFTGLACFHTSFVRLHNNLAANFQNINRHWNADRVFQETRKIVGAVMQVITYQEFLPTLLGPFFQRLMPKYNGYDSSVDPSILNEFAAAAFRLHGMIQEFYPLKNSNFNTVGSVPMQDTSQQVSRITHRDFIDQLYRGFISTPARSPQRITTFMTEVFIQSDMGSVNIQRGRDHGLRSYNEYRKLCNLRPLQSFQDWPEVTDQNVRERVKNLYNGNVDRIDLYVGGLVEEPIEGSSLGPTFSCIIAEQFTRSRDGDRFYFDNPDIFTSAQREALKKASLAWVLCTSSDSFGSIPTNAFTQDDGGSAVPCSSIKALDLSAWAE